jgi:hypothetical protein
MKLSTGICCQDMESSENCAIAHGKSDKGGKDNGIEWKYSMMRITAVTPLKHSESK